ncbi:hypothetical protein OSTOST_19363 [Ostertagia ostertagi]
MQAALVAFVFAAVVPCVLGQVGQGGPGAPPGPGGLPGPHGPPGPGGPGPHGVPGRPRHHGHRGLHRPLEPPYLENVSEEARKDYFKIMFNDNLTVAEEKEKLEEWAKEYKVEDQVKKFEEHMEEVKKNVTELIDSLPTALKEFSEMLEDPNLNHREIAEKLRAFIKTNPQGFQFWFGCRHLGSQFYAEGMSHVMSTIASTLRP